MFSKVIVILSAKRYGKLFVSVILLFIGSQLALTLYEFELTLKVRLRESGLVTVTSIVADFSGKRFIESSEKETLILVSQSAVSVTLRVPI